MATHDGYARWSPYEATLPSDEFAGKHFMSIEAEATANSVDLWNPAAFMMLGAVGSAIGELRPEGVSAEVLPGTALEEHGILLYHAFHVWLQKGVLALAPSLIVRNLLDDGIRGGPSVESWPPSAGYMQLARHQVWLETDLESPETLDGFFWALSPVGIVHILYVAGLLEGRPGFTVVPLPGMSVVEFAEWAGRDAREDGEDFVSALPGRELDHLHGVVSMAEGAKLASLLLTSFHAIGTVDGVAPVGDEINGPRPSELAFVVLQQPEGGVHGS